MSELTNDDTNIFNDISLDIEDKDAKLVVEKEKDIEIITPPIESQDAKLVVEKEKDIEIITPLVKLKKDMPTPNEVKQMSDDEIISNAETVPNDEINELYSDFMGILDTNDKIVADQSDKIFCPTGLDVLDATLGGGLIIGGLSMLVGLPGCGKSMLAMQAMAQAQKKLKNCCMTVYIDSEESTTTERLQMLGVNNPPIRPITQLTLEKVFKVINNLCNFKIQRKLKKAPAIVVWDSIANTLSEKEFEVEDINQAIGYKARFLTHYLPQYIKKCANHNIGLIAVNQLRDIISIGPYSAPRDLKMLSANKSMPGGNSLKYNTFHLLELKVKNIIDPTKPTSKYPFDGVEVVTSCVKNKAFRPNIESRLIGSFTRGFSNFWSNYSFLTETKRMKVGAWNYLVNLPNEKFRTKDAVTKYKEGGLFKDAFDKEVKDAIKSEIIDAYAFTGDNTFI